MNDRIYPADYTLEQWLELRKGWNDPKGDTEWWKRVQQSSLGPNHFGWEPAPQWAKDAKEQDRRLSCDADLSTEEEE